MAKKTQTNKTSKSRKARRARARIDLFGPPSLLPGESEIKYNELFKRVNEELQPTDIFEEFAARDLANAMMDSLRFARLKPELLNGNMYAGMNRILEPLCNIPVQVRLDQIPVLDAEAAAAAWVLSEPTKAAGVEELLDCAGFTMDTIVAETLSSQMDSFEAIDRLETNAQARRYSILREIWRRREIERAASQPVVRVSRLAEIENARANDNEKSPKKNSQDLDIEAAPADEDVSREVHKSKVAGE